MVNMTVRQKAWQCLLSFLLAIGLSITAVEAADLGVWGQIYPVGERDFMTFLQQRMSALQANGAWENTQRDIVARVKSHALQPAPVAGLTTTVSPHVFYYDPTFVLQHDLRDANGRLLLAKGVTVNPLTRLPFHETWLFFNADDPWQVQWAKQQGKTHAAVKYILVRGRLNAAM